MITPAQRAALEARRLELFGAPAPGAVATTPAAVDPRPRFQRGALSGLLVDRFDRIEEKLDPESLLPLVAQADPDACRVFEEHKAEIEWWTQQAGIRVKAEAPQKAQAAARAALEELAGRAIPEGVTVDEFYSQNREELVSRDRAAQMREKAAELQAQADQLVDGVEK